jgi:hypothetical protein
MNSQNFGAREYPYLAAFVTDLYQKFLADSASLFLEKLFEEFYNTNTLYWMTTM